MARADLERVRQRYTTPPKVLCQHSPATPAHPHGKLTKTPSTGRAEQAVYDARKLSKLGEGRVGFQAGDTRPSVKANRAGTRGFRAPEVLMKCVDQTVGESDVVGWGGG